MSDPDYHKKFGEARDWIKKNIDFSSNLTYNQVLKKLEILIESFPEFAASTGFINIIKMSG